MTACIFCPNPDWPPCSPPPSLRYRPISLSFRRRAVTTLILVGYPLVFAAAAPREAQKLRPFPFRSSRCFFFSRSKSSPRFNSSGPFGGTFFWHCLCWQYGHSSSSYMSFSFWALFGPFWDLLKSYWIEPLNRFVVATLLSSQFPTK